jgi:EAL domain-containing protein (putative c-di-GMP-specific phosphodiesterase class I)
MLGELGVAYGQGYFLGKPGPLPLARPVSNTSPGASAMH